MMLGIELKSISLVLDGHARRAVGVAAPALRREKWSRLTDSSSFLQFWKTVGRRTVIELQGWHLASDDNSNYYQDLSALIWPWCMTNLFFENKRFTIVNNGSFGSGRWPELCHICFGGHAWSIFDSLHSIDWIRNEENLYSGSLYYSFKQFCWWWFQYFQCSTPPHLPSWEIGAASWNSPHREVYRSRSHRPGAKYKIANTTPQFHWYWKPIASYWNLAWCLHWLCKSNANYADRKCPQ